MTKALYIVTKSYGTICHVGKPTTDLVEAKKRAASFKKRFKPKAVAQVWKLVYESEMPK